MAETSSSSETRLFSLFSPEKMTFAEDEPTAQQTKTAKTIRRMRLAVARSDFLGLMWVGGNWGCVAFMVGGSVPSAVAQSSAEWWQNLIRPVGTQVLEDTGKIGFSCQRRRGGLREDDWVGALDLGLIRVLGPRRAAAGCAGYNVGRPWTKRTECPARRAEERLLAWRGQAWLHQEGSLGILLRIRGCRRLNSSSLGRREWQEIQIETNGLPRRRKRSCRVAARVMPMRGVTAIGPCFLR